jgi:hypothetical protein
VFAERRSGQICLVARVGGRIHVRGWIVSQRRVLSNRPARGWAVAGPGQTSPQGLQQNRRACRVPDTRRRAARALCKARFPCGSSAQGRDPFLASACYSYIGAVCDSQGSLHAGIRSGPSRHSHRVCVDSVGTRVSTSTEPVWSGNSNVSFAVKCRVDQRLRTKLRTGRIQRIVLLSG